jgi:hypothetical protein
LIGIGLEIVLDRIASHNVVFLGQRRVGLDIAFVDVQALRRIKYTFALAGHVFQEELGLRRDPICRNDVAGEGRARERVDEGFLSAEIPRAHGGRGEDVIEDLRLALVRTLQVGKEEYLVLPNRAADRAAILVAPKWILGDGEEIPGIDLVIADKLEQSAVEPVRAALHGCAHEIGRVPVLGGHVRGEHLKLLERVHIRLHIGAALFILGDVRAVQKPAIVDEAGAVDLHIHG